MYTVLWTKPNIGYEEILPPAKRVWLHSNPPCARILEEPDSRPAKVGIEFANGDVTMYDDGNFYVMNENGKTVATYRLKSPVVAEDGSIQHLDAAVEH